MGERIGTERLRKLAGTLADSLEPFRQDVQVQKLIDLISETWEKKQTPVLSVSCDGVALGLASWSSFETASVAAVSVLVGGKRLSPLALSSVRMIPRPSIRLLPKLMPSISYSRVSTLNLTLSH